MVQCLYRGVAVSTVSVLLLAGCATAHRQAASKPGSVPAGASSPPAETEYRPSEDKLVQAHAHYAQAMIYDMDDEPELALDEFTKAALEDPTNVELVLDLTRRRLQEKHPEKALDLLVKATTVPNAAGLLFARLGLVYSQLGHDGQAIEACQTAIKRSPSLLAGYQTLCAIQLQRAKAEDALRTLDRAARASGTDAEFLVELAGLYANLETQAPSLKHAARPNALAVLNRASQLAPPDPRLNLKLADDYNLLGDSTNAARIYLGLLGKYGELPAMRADLHAKLADIYLRGHDPQNARQQLEAIVRDDPANPQAYYFLGNMASDEKKLPEAIEDFEKTLLLSENFEPAYYDLAEAQINADKPKEALGTLARARAKFPQSFLVEFLSGLACVKEKDYTNAISHFTSAELIARGSDPGRLNAYFYFEVGAASERKGDFNEAERYFEKSLQLSPQFSEALNYLGYMLADRGVKLEKARDLIEKAVKIEPQNPAFLDSLGWVLFRLEKPQEGLVQIQKAVELSADQPDPAIYDHLGDIYTALKQPDKAREAWRKSLSLEPNDQIRKKLESVPDKSGR